MRCLADGSRIKDLDSVQVHISLGSPTLRWLVAGKFIEFNYLIRQSINVLQNSKWYKMFPLKNLTFSFPPSPHPSHSLPHKVTILLVPQYASSVPLCKYNQIWKYTHSPSLTQNVANIHCSAFLLAIILSQFTENFLTHFCSCVVFIWFHHNSLNWSLVDGPLDCIQSLLLQNRAAVENLGHTSCYIYANLCVGKFPAVRLLNPRVNAFVILRDITQLSSTQLACVPLTSIVGKCLFGGIHVWGEPVPCAGMALKMLCEREVRGGRLFCVVLSGTQKSTGMRLRDAKSTGATTGLRKCPAAWSPLGKELEQLL